jgi:hypothetical protein
VRITVIEPGLSAVVSPLDGFLAYDLPDAAYVSSANQVYDELHIIGQVNRLTAGLVGPSGITVCKIRK